MIGMFRDWRMWLDLRGLVFFYLASHLPSFHAVSCVCVFFFSSHIIVSVGEYGKGWIEVKEN